MAEGNTARHILGREDLTRQAQVTIKWRKLTLLR